MPLTPEEQADKEAFTKEFIEQVLSAIQGAYLLCLEEGVTLEVIAERMEATTQEVEDLLYGKTELELRSVAELCYAMGVDITFELVPNEKTNQPLFPAA